jgi:hypothetical protein
MSEDAGIGVACASDDAAAAADVPRFCRWCGTQSSDAAEFCGECGKPLKDAQDTSEQPTAQWMGGGQPPPPPPYVAPYAYGSPPDRGGTSTGLIIGLVFAVIAALGAVAAVVILASSGHSKGPTISTATNAAVTSPAGISAGHPKPASPGKRHKPKGNGGSLVLPAPPKPAAPSHPTPPPGPTAADAAAARGVVFNHWTLIGEGNYEAAFTLFVSGYQSHDTWIADKNRDRPAVSNLSVGSADMHSATSATVPLLSLHTVGLEAPQCHNWSGSYDVTKVNGTWLISQANLSGSSC